MKQDSSYAVGRILRNDCSGVHGLTVEVWRRDDVDKQLATARTDRRGRFTVSYRIVLKDKHKLDDVGIFVTVRDRGQRIVHSSADALGPLVGPALFDVQLSPDTLVGHDADPLDWHPSTPRPQANELMADINLAVELLAADTPRYASLAARGLCPGPVFDAPTVGDSVTATSPAGGTDTAAINIRN